MIKATHLIFLFLLIPNLFLSCEKITLHKSIENRSTCYSSIDFYKENIKKIIISGEGKIIEYRGHANAVKPSYYSSINGKTSSYKFRPLDKILNVMKEGQTIYHFGYIDKSYAFAWKENNKIKTLQLPDDVIPGEVAFTFRWNRSFGIFVDKNIFFYNTENSEWKKVAIPSFQGENFPYGFSIYDVDSVEIANKKIYVGLKNSGATHVLFYKNNELQWETLLNNDDVLITNNFIFKDKKLLSEGFTIPENRINFRTGGWTKIKCYLINDSTYSLVSEAECASAKGELSKVEIDRLEKHLKAYSQISISDIENSLNERGNHLDFYTLIANICDIQKTTLLLKDYKYIGIDLLETKELIRQSILDNNIKLLKELKKSGANFKSDELGLFSLYIAIFNSFMGTRILNYLIEETGAINKKDLTGKTAIFEAIFLERVAAVKLLIKHGASLKITDYNGRTPLAYSIARLKSKEADKMDTGNLKKIVLFLTTLYFDRNNKKNFSDTISLKNNYGENTQVHFDSYFTTITCKRNYKSKEGKRGKVIKHSELFRKLESNPRLKCFLEKVSMSISLNNYETFVRSICDRHPAQNKECREVAEDYLYCLKPRYSKTPFFHIYLIYSYNTLVERTEQIFVDGFTGELIDELEQEIDSESCNGPFLDEEGRWIDKEGNLIDKKEAIEILQKSGARRGKK